MARPSRVLNEAGYARYDERTSAMLGETTELVLDRDGGDLRNLREEAGREPVELDDDHDGVLEAAGTS